MAAIDYEAEYNNRARVPEHYEIFSRDGRRTASFIAPTRSSADAPNWACRMAIRRGNMPICLCGCRRSAPLAMFIHGGWWRSLDPSHVQPDGARPECAWRQCRRGRLRFVPECQYWRYHRADAPRLHIPLAALRPADCLSIGHSAGGHLAGAMVATDWPRFTPRRRRIWCPWATRSPACSISARWSG